MARALSVREHNVDLGSWRDPLGRRQSAEALSALPEGQQLFLAQRVARTPRQRFAGIIGLGSGFLVDQLRSVILALSRVFPSGSVAFMRNSPRPVLPEVTNLTESDSHRDIRLRFYTASLANKKPT